MIYKPPLKNILSTVSQLNGLSVEPIITQLSKVNAILDGLDKEQKILAISSSSLSESHKKLLLTELGLVPAVTADKAATDADTASKYANLKVTNLLKVAWGQLKGFAMANPWLVAISATVLTIAGITKVVDALTTSTEEHKEKLETLKGEYSSIVSELESVNSELETTRERLAELDAKDSLTFTEKEEYDNLVKQNNELQRTLDLLEQEEKQKNKEINKEFVATMTSDTNDNWEYASDSNGNIIKGNAGLWSLSGSTYVGTNETAYIEQQFAEREKNLLRIAEIEEQLKTDINNEALKKEKERLETYNDEINDYLSSKNTEWSSIASEISYIDNPNTDDEKAVNEWLDYIADFQDRMAIAMSGDNAKENAFNRIVDNWQFDEIVQGLQDLGLQGKVTAEMLDDPKYDAFIAKLVELGFIETADDLETIALAFNNVADSADNASDSVANATSSFDVSTLNDAYDSIQKSYDAVQEFKDALADKGLTDSALDAVAGLSDELKALVAEFYAGTISADELFEALTEHYENDLKNYSEAIIAKNEYSEEFYNTVGLSDTDFVNHMKDNYGVDIKNCKTYAEAKFAIEQQLLNNVKTMWSKYYDAQAGAFTSQMDTLNEQIATLQSKQTLVTNAGTVSNNAKDSNVSQVAGLSKEEKEELERLTKLRDTILETTNLYNNAVDELNQVTYEGIASSFEGINNTIDSNSSSSKSTLETYDHIETKLENITKKTEKLAKAFENTFTVKGTEKKFKQYLSQIDKEVEANQTAVSTYQQKLDSIGLSSSWIKKIESGDYSIEDVKDNETLTNQISEYQKWYDKLVACKEKITSLEEERLQAQAEYAEKIIEYQEKEMESLEKLRDKKTSISGKESVYEDQLDLYASQIKALKKLQKTVDEGTDAWKAYEEQIENLKEQREDTKADFAQEVIELQEKANAKIERKIDKRNSRISLKETFGSSASESDYEYLMEQNSSLLEQYESQNDALRKLRDEQKKGSEAWNTYNDQILANKESISDLAQTIADLAVEMANLPIDEYEKYLEKNEKKSALYSAKADNTTSATGRNNYLDKQIALLEKNNQKAQETAQETAQNIDLEIKDITSAKKADKKGRTKAEKTEINEYCKKIQSYTKSKKQIPASILQELSNKGYSNLYQQCTEYNAAIVANETAQATAELSVEETQAEIRALQKQKFDNIQTQYDREQDDINHNANLTNSKMQLAQAKGYLDSASWYDMLIGHEKEKQASLKAERKKLVAQLENIEYGTDEWWDAQDAIQAVDEAIADSTVTLQEYINTQRQVEFDNFEYMMGQISRLTEEANFLMDMMQNKELTNENGGLSDYGIASLGLYVQNLDTYAKQAQYYGAEIKRIQQMLADDPYNTTLIAQLQEYEDAQRDALSATEAQRKAVEDLVKQGYEALADSLSEVADKYKEVLRSAKDASDYQRTISDKTEEADSLRKQIAAYEKMSGNEEVAAKLQKANKKLEEAERDIQETMYDKYISDTEDALDEMLNELETFIEELDFDKIFNEAMTTVNGNTDTIAQILNSIASENGIKVSSDTSSIWTNGYTPEKGFSSVNERLDNLISISSAQATGVGSVTVTKYGSANGYASGSHGILRDQLAWTQENGGEIILRKSDGALLTPLGQGDKVFTNEMSENLWNLAQMNPVQVSLPTMPKFDTVSLSNVGGGDTTIEIGDINMYGVNDPKEFGKQLREEICNDGRSLKCITEAVATKMVKGYGVGKANLYNF